MRRVLKIIGALAVIIILVIATPILYVETACRGTPLPQSPAVFIKDQDDQRAEARTFLTYPEWHIVYAYEGYAAAIADAPPHRFPYLQSIAGFWSSLCALTKEADTLGKAGFDAKSTIYTIGASFILEMAAKAMYEETLGRISAATGTSPHDKIEAEMASQYADFLQQTPWYKFDFDAWVDRLNAAEKDNFRAYERNLALTLEWKAKAGYARLIAKAVAGLGADELTMLIAVAGANLDTQPDVEKIKTDGEIVIYKVPRYRVFTGLVQIIADQGGKLLEIAGNDDILVSMIIEQGDFYAIPQHRLLSRTARVGFSSDRVLLSLKVADLVTVFTGYPNTPIRVEHIYDY